MKVPSTLSQWSLDVVEALLHKGVFESDAFDFKESLPHSKDEEGKRRLRKTIAAFANSGGGFLIFGARDDKGLSVNDRLVGIDKQYDFPANFGNYPASCQPCVEWEFLNPPILVGVGDKVLHICEIKSTWKRPHAVLQDGAFIFPKRTSKGNEDMSYSELKGAFQEAEYRRTKLALLISELEHITDSAQRLLDNVPEKLPKIEGTLHWAWATRYSTTLLDMVLGDAYSFIAEDPELWKLLCLIRESASHSNAACDAFSNIVFLSMSNKEKINQQHYDTVRQCAIDIVDASRKAMQKIKRFLV